MRLMPSNILLLQAEELEDQTVAAVAVLVDI
jgi:hypothetical protein